MFRHPTLVQNTLIALATFMLIACGSDEQSDTSSTAFRHERELLLPGNTLASDELLVTEMETTEGSSTEDIADAGIDEMSFRLLQDRDHELRLNLAPDKDINAQLINSKGELVLEVSKNTPSQITPLSAGDYTLRLINRGLNAHLLFIKPGSTVITDGCQNCNLSNQNFVGTQIGSVSLDGSNLSGATLVGAQCVNTSFKRANLSGASLATANCQGAQFNGANLNGANVNAANLKGADLLGASWDQNTSAVAADLTGINVQADFPSEDHTVATRDVVITANGPLYLTGASSFRYQGVQIDPGGQIFTTGDTDLSIETLSVESSQTPHIVASGSDGAKGAPGTAGADWGVNEGFSVAFPVPATAGGRGGDGQSGGDAHNLTLNITSLSGRLVIDAGGGNGGNGGNGGKGGNGRTATGPIFVSGLGGPVKTTPSADIAYGASGGNGGNGGNGGRGGNIVVRYGAGSSGSVALLTTAVPTGGPAGGAGAAGTGKTPPKASQIPKPGIPGQSGTPGQAATLSVNSN